jgi:HAD superfamily hydrolase (TIGR01484 family)
MEKIALSPYLVFSDFDGTIVDSTFRVLPALSQLLATQNVPLIIVTSRGWDGLRPYTDALHLRLPQLLANGAVIMEPITETLIYKQPIPRPAVRYITRLGQRYGASFGISGLYTSYIDSARALKEEVLRISLVVDPKDRVAIQEQLKKLTDITFINNTRQINEGRIVDITASLVTKLTGIQNWLKQYLSLSPVSTIYVLGNSENDIPMFQLQLPGVRVIRTAIRTAPAGLIKAADAVIDPPEERGFYRFLRALVDNKPVSRNEPLH